MSITLIVHVEASEGKAEELLAFLLKVRESTLNVADCELFDVYQRKDAPNKLLLFERWASADAQQAHFEKNVKGSGLLERLGSLLTAPPRQERYMAC